VADLHDGRWAWCGGWPGAAAGHAAALTLRWGSFSLHSPYRVLAGDKIGTRSAFRVGFARLAGPGYEL
jgi:hypothetical protein